MKTILFFVTGLFLNTCAAISGILNFSNFHSPAQVDAAMTTLASTYPSLTQLITIGNSLEGRPIRVLKISNTPTVSDPTKGDVVFVSLHHAREWISVEMALYLADELLARYASDPSLQADINRIQIWIVPVVNPDGFQYTHSPGGYRYWRKNRKNNGDGSYGVDLNRNWGYQWGLPSGSSGDTFNDLYRGSGPFSEPELVVLRNFLQGLSNLKSFVSYHSYSELYLRPWSYTTSDPPGETTLQSIVQRNIGLIASIHGETYEENIGYTSSGEATDYLWNEMRVAAFTPELRPKNMGQGLIGFAPSPTEIVPCVQENYPAAIALIHDAARTRLYIRDHASDTGNEPSAVWTGTNWSAPFWESPDVWTIPAVLNQGAVVDLNVRVSNNTGATQNNVTLDIYYTDPRISLEFPNPNALLIASRNITVPPAGLVVTVPWTIPMGGNSWGELHWCVGAVVKHQNDMPLTTQVQRSSNVTCKNFNTTPLLASTVLTLSAENFLKVPAELKVALNERTLPEGWKITLDESGIKRTGRVSQGSVRKAKLLQTKGIILEPGEVIRLPFNVSLDNSSTAAQDFNLTIDGALLPLVSGKREALGNGYTYKITKGQ